MSEINSTYGEISETPKITPKANLKVAIVHYWLNNMRGGEKVIESLCKMYPQADIYTHVLDRESLSPLLKNRNIQTTFIQKLPFACKFYQKYLPFMPLALEQLDLTGYDLVISSESGPAKGVLTRADTVHICYCHSPMRYLWDFYQQYLTNASFITRLLMRPIFSSLRQWDVLSANRVDHFIANSKTVAKRINKHWRRKASVIYPPVNIDDFPLYDKKASTTSEQDFYFCAGQLVDYKRIDLAIEACIALQYKLVIAGDGSSLKKLQKLANNSPYIKFVGRVSNTQLYDYLTQCTAFIFPGEEDFGITPVEAMSTGTPIIAYAKGGATESITSETGVFFAEQNKASLMQAIQDFEQKRMSFDAEQIHLQACKFSEENFMQSMQEEINKQIALHHHDKLETICCI